MDLKIDNYMRKLQGLNQPSKSMSLAVMYPMMSGTNEERKKFKNQLRKAALNKLYMQVLYVEN